MATVRALASAMPRYIAGVVKPQAASPSGATAISPPFPPSIAMSASTASSACWSGAPARCNGDQPAFPAQQSDVGEHGAERLLERLAPEPDALGELMRCDGADE